MPFIGPVSGIAGFISQWTGDTSPDTVGDTISLAATNRGNIVSQEFQKKLSGIDYQVQRQELHRQDIRDLVEVTTGRMDVFLLSGTLLLTFCLGWFSGSRIMESQLPTWFENLFLISNFNAVGYLLLCVWLAMHASIASHSLGARLLINYQRLSIPTFKQLNRIYVPLFPPSKVGKLLALGRQMGIIPEEGEEEKDAAISFSQADNAQHSWPLHDGNDDMHFRRFLQAQSKWLAYDAYARVCLTLGMNQMLHALSYYVVGELGKAGCMAGTVFTFLGVKMLSLAVMKLDIADNHGSHDKFWAITCTVLPSLIAAGLLFLPEVLPLEIFDGPYKSLWATPCFILHLGFNKLMCHNIQPVKPSEGEGMQLPRMFRAVGYLSIIELKQRRMAKGILEEATEMRLAELQASRNKLEEIMAARNKQEEEQKAVSAQIRRGKDLNDWEQRLSYQIGHVRIQMEQNPYIESELRAAQRALERFHLWQKAPEILAMFQALQSRDIKDHKTPEEQKALEKSYASFLEQCQHFDLGISDPSFSSNESTAFRGEAVPMSFQAAKAAEDQPRVLSFELPKVRVEVESDTGHRFPAWHDPSTRDWSFKADGQDGKVVSVPEALDVVLPEWHADVQRAISATTTLNSGERASQVEMTQSPTDPERQAFQPPPGVELPPNAPATMPILEYQIPEEATPPDDLPTRLVVNFNKAIGLWWILATVVHLTRSCYEVHLFHSPTAHASVRRSLRSVSSTWPEPAAFFEVASLHCNNSQVVVNDPFSSYTAQRSRDGSLTPLRQLSDTPIWAMHCDSQGCDALSQFSSSNSWLLSPFSSSFGSSRASAVLPAENAWRQVAVARRPCSSSDCNSIRLVGWDGSEVVVVDYEKDALNDNWFGVHSFAVQLGLGQCSAPAGDCPSEEIKYTNVLALQLGAFGRSLLVLNDDGYLDGWDLSTGILRGRWHHNHTAMCHDDENLFLARQAEDGPVIETAPLPPLLTEEHQPEARLFGCDMTRWQLNFLKSI